MKKGGSLKKEKFIFSLNRHRGEVDPQFPPPRAYAPDLDPNSDPIDPATPR